MDLNNFFQSRVFKGILYVLAALIIILVIFRAGMIVGFKKANFSYRWGENYHQNFAGPRHGFPGDFANNDFIEPHGVIGQIIKIDGASIVIKGKDDVEKIILIKDDSLIKKFNNNLKLGDLKLGDLIITIGEPNNNGQIETKFIRVMPTPEGNTALPSFPPPPPPNL